MQLLRPERVARFDAAIADARAGRPRVVLIEGASGTGKTTHLRALLDAAPDFVIVAATCSDAVYQPHYGLLEELGVVRTSTDDGTPHSPAVAAQSLRRLIDERSRDDPLVIAIDDAQWADRESLDALRLVLDRVRGDRLLVAVATREIAASARNRWQRQLDLAPSTTVLRLDGIDLDEADAMIRELAAGTEIPDGFVERLWSHTGRNPMYLRSLLTQYGIEYLSRPDDLPAPIELARDLDARLSAMNPQAARLLRAIAVVGSDWVDRLDAAAIAQVDDPADALELLADSQLIVVRATVPLAEVRIVHALVRAAVYQSIPPAERRHMHQQASELLTSSMQRLEHAVAAVERRDDLLAADLEDAAGIAHAAPDHRREAQLLRWASQLSSSVPVRERRWLDAQLAAVLAGDLASVRAQLVEIGLMADIARRTVVLAWLLIAENRVADARRTLGLLSAATIADTDGLTRTRLLVLKACTMLVSGFPTGQIKTILDSLPDDADADPALRPYYLRVAGQVASREFDFDHIRRDFEAVPIEARETPMADTDRLSWRGAVYSLCGFAAEARRDLSEVVSRVRSGRVDGVSGVNHALFGFALWHDGEFERATLELQAAADLSAGRLHPLVQAVRPLVPTVRGDFTQADLLLGESEAVLRDLPWHEAVSVLIQAQVVRLHAGGESGRAEYLSRLRSTFGSGVTSAANAAGAIWHLHMAFAKIWASELDDVDAHLNAIETDMIVPDWVTWCRPWLRGLARERAGDAAAAHQQLIEATTLVNMELPLYAGHLHADLARVSAKVSDRVLAAESAGLAKQRYASLGAAGYLAQAEQRTPASADPLGSLSIREREVAALLLDGFSYAQIAEELYVTRSTVAFHLGRIYAKTGVSSRHELIKLVRG